MSTSLKIIRQNGGIKPVAESNDERSGILMYMPDANLPSGFSTSERIKKISTLEEAESLGIISTAQITDSQGQSQANYYVKSLWYHIREAFAINEALELWVGLFVEPATMDFTEVKTMQLFANGEIRQIGVYAPDKELAKEDVKALQAVATVLENADMPLSIVYVAKVTDVTSMTDCTGKGNRNVSVLVGQEMDTNSYAYGLYNAWQKPVGSIGTAIGTISLAGVEQCIANVSDFDTKISVAGFVDGKKYRDLTLTQREDLEDKRVLFFKTYAGYSGVYFNDSYTQDVKDSDYNAIERMRVMDKAARGVREYLLPYVAGNITIDTQTGKIDATDIAVMRNEGQRYLEYMEKRGELSGYKVEIDSEQNILSTSELEIVIKQVPKGVMRKITVKMGYSESVE